MSTQLSPAVEIDPSTGKPRLAHLIAPDYCCDDQACDGDGSLCGGSARDGATKAFEARLSGSIVRTLCQQPLQPSRDPRNLPTCPRCLEVLREETGADDDRDCREG